MQETALRASGERAERNPVQTRTPLVKVIVPCYGYADHLGECVHSVLGQAGVEVRVLIVDDCSPDRTPVVGQRLAAADDRVEYRRHERNQGLIATANEGLGWAADSDYVAIVSADDMLAAGSLQRATSTMEANPKVGLAYGRAVQFASGQPLPAGGSAWAGAKIWSDEGWIRLPLPRADRWRGTKVWSGEEWIRIRCRSGHGCISSPEAVVRTSVQREAGLYDEAAGHMSEVNMWLRVAAISDVAYLEGIAQAFYRIHTESMSRTMLTDTTGPLVEITDRRTAFESFFSGAGKRLPEASRLRDTASRTLARQALWRASRTYDRGTADGVEGQLAEDLVAFALETYPRARRLPEWWGLRLRRRIGSGRSLWFPLFPVTGAAHRLRAHYNRFRLHARGI
jgi:glycosyltransferase involved in cell wall biosynthesis